VYVNYLSLLPRPHFIDHSNGAVFGRYHNTHMNPQSQVRGSKMLEVNW